MYSTENLDPLSLAAEAGRRILESGGETYRAEEAVVRLCRAWDFTEAECFATPTGLIASVADYPATSRAVVRRIEHRSVDLRRIARLVEIIERTEKEGIDPEEFQLSLAAVSAEKPYPLVLSFLAAGSTAAFFTLLFGGTLQDAATAFFVGIGIKATSVFTVKRGFPDFIVNIAGGFVAASLSALAIRLGLALHLDKTVIGSIMLLVPGLATVNAIRDTIAGDLVAGIARLSDAFMAAAAISLGTGFALTLSAMIERNWG
ncbi:threonine/serine exporter family protein [Treponema sp.]